MQSSRIKLHNVWDLKDEVRWKKWKFNHKKEEKPFIHKTPQTIMDQNKRPILHLVNTDSFTMENGFQWYKLNYWHIWWKGLDKSLPSHGSFVLSSRSSKFHSYSLTSTVQSGERWNNLFLECIRESGKKAHCVIGLSVCHVCRRGWKSFRVWQSSVETNKNTPTTC